MKIPGINQEQHIWRPVTTPLDSMTSYTNIGLAVIAQHRESQTYVHVCASHGFA